MSQQNPVDPQPSAPPPEPGIVIEFPTTNGNGTKGSTRVKAEVFAKAFRHSGQPQAAAEQEGKKYEPGFGQKVKDVMDYAPTVGDFVKAGGVVAVGVGVWELTALGLRKWTDVKMPSLFGKKGEGKVVPLRKVGGM
jgi:hypothetical protein